MDTDRWLNCGEPRERPSQVNLDNQLTDTPEWLTLKSQQAYRKKTEGRNLGKKTLKKNGISRLGMVSLHLLD